MANARAIVVGAGRMGRLHARVLRNLEGVELVGVVDQDAEAAASVAHAYECEAFGSIDEVDDIDIAVVAVPTVAHEPVALALIDRGTSVLVEKPLAPSSEAAKRIIDRAREKGVVLGVGHIERFNPAIASLAEIVNEPLLMQFERLSPYTPRIRESIVFDLMVHDLDIACMLAGGTPHSVVAHGSCVFSDTWDIASAVLRFRNGCIASLQASRATQDKVRRVAVSERERFVLADCLRQEVAVKRETQVSYQSDAVFTQASVVELPYVDRRAEPLVLEASDFLDAWRARTQPRVTGEDGLRAVQLAEAVEQSVVRGAAAEATFFGNAG